MRVLSVVLVGSACLLSGCSSENDHPPLAGAPPVSVEVPGAKDNATLPVVFSARQEPAGANCPAGGVALLSGPDKNRNGVLDPGEVTNTQYTCNGTNGKASLVKTTAVAAGNSVCPTGGTAVTGGVDTNNNGALDSGEVTTTSYVCNGAVGPAGAQGPMGVPGTDGLNSLVAMAPIPAGADCANGGQAVYAGLDANKDKTLQPGERAQVSFVCNGTPGAAGADGSSALISQTVEPPGANCANGGTHVEAGLDTNDSGTLDQGEATSSFYACNGAPGQDGADGPMGAQGPTGASGANSLIKMTFEPIGSHCAAGGTRVDTGVDTNDSGVLDGDEIRQTAYVCNGSSDACAPLTECQVSGASVCVDLQSDPTHCGGCTTECPAFEHTTASCVNGTCTTACNAGYADCNAIAIDGCEMVVKSDRQNCGSCGQECSSDSLCTDGACVVSGPILSVGPPTSMGSGLFCGSLFGTVIGTSATSAPVVVSNLGPPASILTATVTQPSGDFVAQVQQPLVIPGGSHVSFTVAFTPTRTGYQQASLLVQSSDPGLVLAGSNVVFVLGLGISPPPPPCTDCGTWQSESTGGTTLRSVWGSGSSVFAVGDAGTIMISPGTGSWSLQNSGTPMSLRGVWGEAGAAFFAVGDGGTILRWTGANSWVPLVSGTTANLRAVWGTGAQNAYVAGENGVILHTSDGGMNWSPQTSGTAANLNALSGSGSLDVLAAGAAGTVLKGNGSFWSSQISNYTGALTSVWGATASGRFAAGSDGAILSQTNGVTWQQQQSGVTTSLNGIWGNSVSDLYAVGANGVIVHSTDGSVWTSQTTPTTLTLNGVWGSGSLGTFAVGDAGTILHKAP